MKYLEARRVIKPGSNPRFVFTSVMETEQELRETKQAFQQAGFRILHEKIMPYERQTATFFTLAPG